MAKKKFRKVPLNPGLVKDPDDDWNEPEPDSEAAVAKCEGLLEAIRDAPAGVWSRSGEFLEDIEGKVQSVLAAAQRGQLTRGQEKALAGWSAGVDKCLARG